MNHNRPIRPTIANRTHIAATDIIFVRFIESSKEVAMTTDVANAT